MSESEDRSRRNEAWRAQKKVEWIKSGIGGTEDRTEARNKKPTLTENTPTIHASSHHPQVPPALLAQEARGGGEGDECVPKSGQGERKGREEEEEGGRDESRKRKESHSPREGVQTRVDLRGAVVEVGIPVFEKTGISASIECTNERPNSVQTQTVPLEHATNAKAKDHRKRAKDERGQDPPKDPCIHRQIRMVARHDRGAREKYLQRDEGLHAEADGVDEVDDVRGEGA
ncbi:hypothetical protein B0H13DRAFT_1889522 [Mycena leptocephala]|nr:hypothetical protein B0H13DRAFT_1889522 [Mycena leptocephala]